MGQIMDALAPTQIMASANRSDYEIKLVNGSKIWFRSAERADTIRGLSINYLFMAKKKIINIIILKNV